MLAALKQPLLPAAYSLLDWRLLLARSAPRRPDVDENRDLIAAHVLFERQGIGIGGMRLEHSLTALAAARLGRGAPGHQAIDGRTLRTNDFSVFLHLAYSCSSKPHQTGAPA